MKIEGGIKDIIHNDNVRTKYFLVAPILKDIAQEVKTTGPVNARKYMKHRQLNESQSEKEGSLIRTLNDVEFDMGAVNNKILYNIVSGRVFPENI